MRCSVNMDAGGCYWVDVTLNGVCDKHYDTGVAGLCRWKTKPLDKTHLLVPCHTLTIGPHCPALSHNNVWQCEDTRLPPSRRSLANMLAANSHSTLQRSALSASSPCTSSNTRIFMRPAATSTDTPTTSETAATTAASFLRPHLRKLAPYTPIEPFEVLSGAQW